MGWFWGSQLEIEKGGAADSNLGNQQLEIAFEESDVINAHQISSASVGTQVNAVLKHPTSARPI
jgi:hypothetical protein